MKNRVLTVVLLVALLLTSVLAIWPDLPLRVQSRLGLVDDEALELTNFYHRIVRYHRRISGASLPGSAHFIGDSFIQGLAVSSVAAPAINLGIGGDTTLGVLKRIGEYPSLNKAAAVVLAVGFNDLWRHDTDSIAENYRKIIAQLPPHVPLLMNAVFPVNESIEPGLVGMNQRIAQLNGQLQPLCQSLPQCTFVDIRNELADSNGNLAERFQDGDGLHLNAAGNMLWIRALQAALVGLGDPERSKVTVSSSDDRAVTRRLSSVEYVDPRVPVIVP